MDILDGRTSSESAVTLAKLRRVGRRGVGWGSENDDGDDGDDDDDGGSLRLTAARSCRKSCRVL